MIPTTQHGVESAVDKSNILWIPARIAGCGIPLEVTR